MKIYFYTHTGFDQGGAKISSLHSFLESREFDVERPRAPLKDDELGGEFLDQLNTVLEFVADVIPLVVAYLDWKKTNRVNQDVEVTLEIPDSGIKITLKGEDEEVLQNVKSAIEQNQKSEKDGDV